MKEDILEEGKQGKLKVVLDADQVSEFLFSPKFALVGKFE